MFTKNDHLTFSSPSLTYKPKELLRLGLSNPTDPVSWIPLDIHRDSSQWGISEEISTLLSEEDSKPIANALLDNQQPVQTLSQETPGKAIKLGINPNDSSEVLFNFNSVEYKAPPILIDFNNPFGQTKDGTRTGIFNFGNPGKIRRDSLSSFSSSESESGSALVSNVRAVNLGQNYIPLRDKRTSSTDSISTFSSFSSSPIMRKGSLNPFAAPFPLPSETPIIISNKSSTTAPQHLKEIPSSVPLPKALPPSLPARPGPPPPVFVKKESATLPQPMALPAVKPMGTEWGSEENISGNEKRRRASQVNTEGSGGQGDWRVIKSLDERPERLKMLGKNLRRSIAESV